jgi:signal transduction histidine kinase
LDVAKVESGHISISLEPVDVLPLLGECLAMTQLMAHKRGLHISHTCPDGLCITADRMRLKQILLNLLSNAIKYNREGGAVRITVQSAHDNRVRIRIADAGHGIPAERIRELFQPFNRLGAENSTIQGTGLGLAITRRITELMGGSIGAESKAGTGSTFWIELPGATPLTAIDIRAADAARHAGGKHP